MLDKNGKGQWQKISIGLKGTENVEVTNGLNEGEITICAVSGQDMPREGRAVKHDKL